MGLVDRWKQDRRDKAQLRAWEAFDGANGPKLLESVKGGARVDATDGAGFTMAHRAIQLQSSTMVPILDEAGADWNLALPDGRNALHLAVESGQSWWVDAMLSRHVELNKVNAMGLTPLHLASRAGSSQIIRMLHNAGASWEMRDKQSKNPLDVLSRHHPALHATWVRVLEDEGNNRM